MLLIRYVDIVLMNECWNCEMENRDFNMEWCVVDIDYFIMILYGFQWCFNYCVVGILIFIVGGNMWLFVDYFFILNFSFMIVVVSDELVVVKQLNLILFQVVNGDGVSEDVVFFFWGRL